MTTYKRHFWYLTPESPNDSEFESTCNYFDYGEAERKLMAYIAPNTEEQLKIHRESILNMCGIPKEFLTEEQCYRDSAAEARMARAVADQRNEEVRQMIFDACTKKGVQYVVPPLTVFGGAAQYGKSTAAEVYRNLWNSDRNKPDWMIVEEAFTQPYKKAIAEMNQVKIDGVVYDLKPFDLQAWRYCCPAPRVMTERGYEVQDLAFFPSAENPYSALTGVIKGGKYSWNANGLRTPSTIGVEFSGYADLRFAVKAPEPKRRLITVKEMLDKSIELYVKARNGVIVTVVSRDPQEGMIFTNGEWNAPLYYKNKGITWGDGDGEWHSFEVIEHPDGAVEFTK